MRKLIIYLKFLSVPLVLFFITVLFWFFVPDNLSNFKSTLLGAILGVLLSFSTVNSFQKLIEYKRLKKTFGLLKLIIIPYLKNQAENLRDTLKTFSDLCSIKQAVPFFTHCALLDKMAVNFDKSWLNLIYSHDYLDEIKDDEHFNRTANAIFEILLFIKQLSAQSINAQINLQNDWKQLSDEQKKDLINHAQKMRNALMDSVEKLLKYTNKLDKEITNFLSSSGVSYSEFER